MNLMTLSYKFTNGQKILYNFLGSQICVFDKGSISYKPNLKQNYYKNYFVKATSINDQIACHYCNRNGHMNYKCSVKKNAQYGIKCVWVPKEIIANTQRSKSFGYLKLRFLLLGSKKKKWQLDYGCSRHMKGNYFQFLSFIKIKNGGEVSFGDNSQGKLIGISNVGKESFTFIENVCLVENLKHNFLSISQLRDKGYRVIFYKTKCVIENVCVCWKKMC